ncbi:hypothetical protein [Telmatospirillum sp.]|uniref:hypothetical protein n=1 Tax=Telmatospirillum sp. TaxID=2079197 RepID=UPI00283D8122|nr:hypothetical protein [Telmatospirillum sp.]MDR3437453.1 hypothetical protein [Telmatospirillum sp.]
MTVLVAPTQGLSEQSVLANTVYFVKRAVSVYVERVKARRAQNSKDENRQGSQAIDQLNVIGLRF